MHPSHPPRSILGVQEVLLIENDIITTPFTPAVHDCVPPLPWSVTDAELTDPK